MNYKIYTSYHKDELIEKHNLINDEHHILYPTHKNIDGKNLNYLHDRLSDFCAMYYVYKNNKYCDFVGFDHYRRKLDVDFINNCNLQSDECIVRLVSPLWLLNDKGERDHRLLTNKEAYGGYGFYDDWNIYINILNTLYGKDNIYVYLLNNSSLMIWDDIFMMSWDNFIKFGNFLFTIEDVFDTYINSIYKCGKYNMENYLKFYHYSLHLIRPNMLERLVSVWIFANFERSKIKIMYCDEIVFD